MSEENKGPVDEEEEEDYSNMDKLKIPYYEKDQGTQAFQARNYQKAAKHYSKSVMAYNFIIKDGLVQDKETLIQLQREVQLPSTLNLAICYMKLDDYKTAISFCQGALQIDSQSVKGLYRLGLCYSKLGDFSLAKKNFNLVLQIDPTNDDVRQGMLDLENKITNSKKRQVQISQKMMEALDYSDLNQVNTNDQLLKKKSKLSQIYTNFKDFMNKTLQILMCRKKKKQD